VHLDFIFFVSFTVEGTSQQRPHKVHLDFFFLLLLLLRGPHSKDQTKGAL